MSYVNTVVVFLNISFFLLISPFRLKALRSGEYIVSRNMVHSMLWIITRVTGNILIRSRSLISAFQTLSNNSLNPTTYLIFFSTIVQAASALYIQKLLWFNQPQLLSLVNYISLNSLHNLAKCKLLVRNFCLLNILCPMYHNLKCFSI